MNDGQTDTGGEQLEHGEQLAELLIELLVELGLSTQTDTQ